MDFGRAFSYVFDDPDWLKKVGIAGLVLIIPIIGQIVVIGWMLRIVRNVINRDPKPLPELDFGTDLGNGFKGFIVSLVYSLPIVIVSLISQAAGVGASYGGYNGSDAATGAMSVLVLCLSCVSFIYGLAMAFVLPAAYARLVVTDSLGAAFNFSEIIALVRKNPSAYLIVVLGTIVAALVGSLGLIACVIGVVFTMAYAMAIQGHLYGQAYLAADGGTGLQAPIVRTTPPTPPAPPVPPTPPAEPPASNDPDVPSGY